jgi:plasmid replication initiation protein
MATKSNLPANIRSKTKKVYKNSKLNNARFANFNLNDYQVFLYVVSKLGKVDEHNEYLQPEKLQRTHTITALEFSEMFNLDKKTAYVVIKNATRKLMKADIVVHEINEFSKKTVQINLCEKAEYIENEGRIELLLTGSIMPYLAQVKQKFVLYNLKEIANFGSLYTTRLYELIQEFKDTGYIIRSIDQLRELFAVGETLKLYTNFKAKTFEHAINEINAKTGYNITFTEIKTGRKVTSIQFEFKKTVVEKRFKPDGSQVNNYIKPKHNSDKIEAAKAIETPKKPAPTIQKTERMTSLSPIASAIMEDIKNKYGKK